MVLALLAEDDPQAPEHAQALACLPDRPLAFLRQTLRSHVGQERADPGDPGPAQVQYLGVGGGRFRVDAEGVWLTEMSTTPVVRVASRS